MNVVVANNCVPFVRGGAEHLADALVTKLEEGGHRAHLVRLPFRWDPPDAVLESMLATSLVRIERADRVVGLKFPAYLVEHDNKVLWLLHQFRQVYDLWGTDGHELPDTASARVVRDAVRRADGRCFAECVAIYANSPVTAERLGRFNGVTAGVLLAPPPTPPTAPPVAEYGDTIVCLGRVAPAKRQHLAIEAMAYVRSGVRLIVAGPPETPEVADDLRGRVARLGVESRVELRLRYQSEPEKQELLREARACAYFPFDEDSYGYVTLESLQAAKPVVTTTDSGGVRLLVDRDTGVVVEPEPAAIAEAFDALADDAGVTRELGHAGRERVRSLDLSWEHVVEVLTA